MADRVMERPREDSPPPLYPAALADSIARDDSLWLPRPEIGPYRPDVHYLSPWARVECRGMFSKRVSPVTHFSGSLKDKTQQFHVILNRRHLPMFLRAMYWTRSNTCAEVIEFDPRQESTHVAPLDSEEVTFSFPVFPQALHDPSSINGIDISIDSEYCKRFGERSYMMRKAHDSMRLSFTHRSPEEF